MTNVYFYSGCVAKRALEKLGLAATKIDAASCTGFVGDKGYQTYFLASLYSDLNFEILEFIYRNFAANSLRLGLILADSAEDLYYRIVKFSSSDIDIGHCDKVVRLVTDIQIPKNTPTVSLNQNIKAAKEQPVDILYISTRSDGISAFLGDRCLCGVNSENWAEASKALSCIGSNYCHRVEKKIFKESMPVEALLHKSVDGQISPFPGRIYPTGSVTGMPRAV